MWYDIRGFVYEHTYVYAYTIEMIGKKNHIKINKI